MVPQILIIDDEQEFATSLAEYLRNFSMDVRVLTDPTAWERVVSDRPPDLVLLDIRMPAVNGFDVLRGFLVKNWSVPVIMISGHASVENIVKAMRFGAHNFYEKPIDLEALVTEIKRIIESRLARDGRSIDTRIITENPRMQEIVGMIERTSDTNASVLIVGESGTGKELVANSLHRMSRRRERPIVKLNCAAIPDALLESELFGYEPGAFTDARQQKLGKFEIADGGTIFFDELTEMSMNIQAKLLRVIQDCRFERLGGSDLIYADARIVSATNQDIYAAVAERRFREDLYYRMAVVTLEIPPLRERKEDIMPLARHFLAHYARIYQRSVAHFDEEVERVFLSHTWVGNVRELKNVIERAVIFSDGDTLVVENLPEQYASVQMLPLDDLERVYESLSREAILTALRKAGGKKQTAAEILNVHRKTLYNRMKKLGIQV